MSLLCPSFLRHSSFPDLSSSTSLSSPCPAPPHIHHRLTRQTRSLSTTFYDLSVLHDLPLSLLLARNRTTTTISSVSSLYLFCPHLTLSPNLDLFSYICSRLSFEQKSSRNPTTKQKSAHASSSRPPLSLLSSLLNPHPLRSRLPSFRAIDGVARLFPRAGSQEQEQQQQQGDQVDVEVSLDGGRREGKGERRKEAGADGVTSSSFWWWAGRRARLIWMD